MPQFLLRDEINILLAFTDLKIFCAKHVDKCSGDVKPYNFVPIYKMYEAPKIKVKKKEEGQASMRSEQKTHARGVEDN